MTDRVLPVEVLEDIARALEMFRDEPVLQTAERLAKLTAPHHPEMGEHERRMHALALVLLCVIVGDAEPNCQWNHAARVVGSMISQLRYYAGELDTDVALALDRVLVVMGQDIAKENPAASAPWQHSEPCYGSRTRSRSTWPGLLRS